MPNRTTKQKFLTEYPSALNDDVGTLFIGAGVSVGAGYPSWVKLLSEIGEELGVSSKDALDLAALAQWSIQTTGGANRIRKLIRDEIAPELPVPESLRTIARLPIRHIWTTNYDTLIERSFSEIGRPIDTISSPPDLAIRSRAGATKLYKMHGTISNLSDIVISTDDYELYRSRRGAYLPLLTAHLTSTSMLFVGLSFTDPNVRHVLALIRENFTDAPPEHFAIVKPPQKDDYRSDAEFKARQIQHDLWAKDLNRYGLIAVEIDDYDEVPNLLQEIEQRVARGRIWMSGSWPIQDHKAPIIYEIADKLGQAIGKNGYSLVSGSGLTVGSASISGFMTALREKGIWDLERRLITRPFPQPLGEKMADKVQWTALRKELARLSGTIIIIGGAKFDGTDLHPADGVFEEVEIAKQSGAFVLPLGCTGGTAEEIASTLIGSKIDSDGRKAQRPSDEELKELMQLSSVQNVIELTLRILQRVRKI